MTIDKAIEILEDLSTDLPQFSPDDRRDATKLGIEALKRVGRTRDLELTDIRVLLPGETLE